MKTPPRFKLLTKFTSLICSLRELMSSGGVSARKGFLTWGGAVFLFLFLLNPFFSLAQFPYDETFRNATTNKPDVVFGGDLTAFLTAGNVPPKGGAPLDAAGQGYLRLTNIDNNQKGYVYSNNIFLGTYGLNIEFEYYTYGGTGADGICFFLFDATVPTFNIGAFGGSLGYSQKSYYEGVNKINLPGVTKGYLGIGLDEYGNFANSLEDRVGGLTPAKNATSSLFPDYVVIRGAGDGYSTTTSNYEYLTSKLTNTGSDAFTIAGGKRGVMPGDPAYRKVFISLKPIKPGVGLLINVSIQHGNIVTPVIVNYPYNVAVPASGLKYGIASSTGGSNNYHEIRGLSLSVDKSVLDQPKAPSPSIDICQGASGSLDILTGATKPNAGGDPNPANVDLDPSTPEIDQKITTPAGTFQFDLANTKKLIYTPDPAFTGSSASITFTFMDIYGAKSSVGTATFNINSPIITTQPKGATICENSNFTSTVIATGPNLSYQWESFNPTSGWSSLPDPDGSLGAKTNTLTISRVPATYNSNQYRVRVNSPGGCNITSDVVKLTVNQLPTTEISPIGINICEGGADVPVIFTGSNGTGPYTFSYTVSDGTTTSAVKTITTLGSSNSITINQPTTIPGTFTYTILNVSNSTCSNAQFQQSAITVTPKASIGLVPASGTAIQSVCAGKAIKTIVYQVQNAGIASINFDKLNPDITGVYDPVKKQIIISGTSSAVGKFSFTVNTLGGCGTATTTGEINVLPNTAIALSSAVLTDQQALCINHAITPIEYLVTNGKNATVTGLPVELTSGYDAVTGKFTINGTPKTAGLITYTITATGDCDPATITGTIQVKPDVTIALSSAALTDQQTLCVNHAITQIQYLVTNGKSATVTGLPVELTSNYDAATGKFTISGTPKTAGLITYTITATGDCEPATITGTIQVKPDVTIALSSAALTDQQTLCVNHAITQIQYLVTNGKSATVTGLPVELTPNYDATTGKFTISGTPKTAGLITYTITATGDCDPATTTGTIQVKPDVTIALSSAALTDQQTLCVNHAITQIQYLVTNGKSATVTGLPVELTSNYDAATGKFTISGTPKTAGLITYTITATGDCEPATITGTIQVKPDVTIALSSAALTDQQTLCVNHAITQIQYLVTNGKNATVTGLPVELTPNYDATTGKFTISGTPKTAGLITYTITATGDCGPATITGTIQVKPDVTIALSSAALTDQQTLCVNHAITQIQYLVTNGKNATVTGLPVELTPNYDATTGKFTISGTPKTAGLITYTITATGDCGPATITGTIQVKPDVTIALSSAALTNQQTLCVNHAITQIQYLVTNGKNATVTGLPIELTGNYDAATGKFTISGTPKTAGLITYTITATGDCQPATITGTIQVKPDVTIVLSSAALTDQQTLCVNHAITQIQYLVTNGRNATVTGLPVELTSNYDAATGKFTISGTPKTAGLITYTITATGDCEPATITGTIQVKPDVTIALSSAALTDQQTLCVNHAITQIQYLVTNGKNATITGLPIELTGNYDAATGKFTISGTPKTAGLITYTITATGDCEPATITGTIQVKPDVTIALSSAVNTDQQILCINHTITQIEYLVANGKNATVTGLPIELTGNYDAATGKFTISGTPKTAGLITYTITATGDCQPATITGTIQVKPDVTIALSSAALTDQQTLCVNHAITQIQYLVTNGRNATITGLPIELTGNYDAATGKFTISGTPKTAGLITYTITATGDCQPATITGIIQVKPDVTIVLSSAVNTDQQTLCVNHAITQIQYLVTNGRNATVTGLPVELTSNYDAATGKFTISGAPKTAGLITYTITATGDCQPATITGTIQVKPDVTIVLSSAVLTDQQTLCVNHAITQIQYLVTNGKNATVTGLPVELTSNYDAATGKFTISGAPKTAGLITYTITATGDCGPATITGTIQVKPDVTIALSSAALTDQQTLCVNHAITQIQYLVTNGRNATITGLPIELTGNYDAATGKFTISGTPKTAGLITYTITATSDCQPATITGTIQVKPDVNIALSSAVNTDQQTLCVSHAITQIQYLITNGKNATVTGLPIELTGNYDAATGKFTISGTPKTAGLITYTITATGDCQSVTTTGTIKVKPNVEISLTSGSNNQSACINTPITGIVYTINNGTAIATNLPTGLIQNYSSGLLTISGTPSQPGTFLYTVTITGDCDSKQLQGQIDVYPNATMDLISPVGSDQPVLCINTPLTPIVYKITNATGVTTSSLPAGITGSYNPATKEFTIIGNPALAGTFPYTITTTGGCASVTLNGVIKVNPNASLQLTSALSTTNQTLCVNSNNLQTITYKTTNATEVTVTGLPSGILWTYTNEQVTINGNPGISGVFNYIVRASGLCQAQQLNGTITVTPSPVGFNDVISGLTCTNNSIQYNLQDNVNNTASGGNSIPSQFTWTVAPNNNVKGQRSGSGNIINATLTNTSHIIQQVIYSITPTSVSGGCPGNTFTVTVNVPVCNGLAITKTANVNVVSAAGDQIQYTITVKNTGTANHTHVEVTDPFLGGRLTGPAYGDNGNGILEANESWVYTGTYRVTQTDIDDNGKPTVRSGKIINTATVNTAEAPAPLTAVSMVDIVTNGSIVLVKTGVISSDFSTIVYTFKITNTGRVKLYNLNLIDTRIGGKIELPVNEIAAGASITVTATYKVSDEEKRDGRVVNTATVNATTPSGDPVSDISGTQANNDDPTVHIIVDAPQAIDDKAQVQINQVVTINIAGNDFPSHHGLNKASVEINSRPSNGRIDVHSDGTVTYTPDRGYSGKDEFTYYIYDSKAGTPNKSNKAYVNITVTPIELFIPNTITPNGDGKNDTFKIIGRESFDGIELIVFNRWGNEVYKNNNYLDDWDGSGLTEGTYYYIITLKKAGSKVTKNGWILIKR